MTMINPELHDFTLINEDGDEIGRYALAGDYENFVPCGHEGCDYAFDPDALIALDAHHSQHRDACMDITIEHRDCEFCAVTKDDQLDAYLKDESIEHPFCDQDAIDEDGDPAACDGNNILA